MYSPLSFSLFPLPALFLASYFRFCNNFFSLLYGGTFSLLFLSIFILTHIYSNCSSTTTTSNSLSTTSSLSLSSSFIFSPPNFSYYNSFSSPFFFFNIFIHSSFLPFFSPVSLIFPFFLLVSIAIFQPVFSSLFPPDSFASHFLRPWIFLSYSSASNTSKLAFLSGLLYISISL